MFLICLKLSAVLHVQVVLHKQAANLEKNVQTANNYCLKESDIGFLYVPDDEMTGKAWIIMKIINKIDYICQDVN